MQQNMRRRGKNLKSKEILSNVILILSNPDVLQTQSRSRDCNTAQNGGSTSICTSTQTISRSCNTNGCCRDDWEAHDDHCYYWSTNTKTWNEAEAFCRQENSHLASITSEAISRYMLEGMNSKGLGVTWIGGTDKDGEGIWKWTDGSPF